MLYVCYIATPSKLKSGAYLTDDVKVYRDWVVGEGYLDCRNPEHLHGRKI